MPRRRPSNFGNADDAARQIARLADAFARLPRNAQVLVVVLAVVAAAAYLWIARNPISRQPILTSSSASTLLGLPSPTTSDASNRNDYHVVKPYFDLSYNDAIGTANWVSWRVTSADLGDAARKQMFDSDPTLPSGFVVVQHQDYSNSGFDRGHLCPHSDRAANEPMSFATFVMTNIIPQAPNVNERAWAASEDYLRSLVRGGSRLYVFAGPSGRGGSGSKGFVETIARGRVVVPAFCWKVAVVVPERGQPDALADFTGAERVIGIWMPNDNAIGDRWAEYRVSAATIEQRTGLHFFTTLPPPTADALRARLDTTPIP